MRIIDNSTYDDGAAYNIAMEMQKMVCGAGWSKSKTWAAFLRLTRRRVHVEKSCRYIQFYRRHWQAVALYFDSLLLSSFSGIDEAGGQHNGAPPLDVTLSAGYHAHDTLGLGLSL
eukprot:SAG31_NODE_180_length_21118_cov_62.152671_7_plen_115_part_00